MEERLIFSEIEGIETFMCVLGLTFPESATEFQKAFLTLAHLCASSRDFVLKGHDVPNRIIDIINELAIILDAEQYKQR